jgi:hypothetical protein
MLRRFVVLLALPVLLGACAATTVRTADPAEVARAAYVHDAPPSVTLITVVNSSSGAGDHSALIINGAQRILYDPAGSFHHPDVPQHLDVHFGLRPIIEDIYINYHARETHHVVAQHLAVTPEVAQAALSAALGETKARQGQCSVKTTAVLRAAGIEGVGGSIWPRTTMNNFAELAGVRTEILVAPGANPQVWGLDDAALATAERVTAPSGLYRPVLPSDLPTRAAAPMLAN